MPQTKKALFYSVLIVLALPHVAEAQSFLDSVSSPGDVSFSNNSILPLQGNYPPLDSAVNLGLDLNAANNAAPTTGVYNPSGIFEVDDINQAAKDSKPNFLKDLFLGADPNRALHPSTVKVFNILGKAQKGLQTYKLGRSVFDAVKGKNPEGIVGGARSLLLLYGIIDPNSAVASAAALGTSQSIATVASAATGPSLETRIKTAAFDKPETPRDWIIKSQNNDSLRSIAAQEGSQIVLSPEGQKLLGVEDGFTDSSVAAMGAIISDAAQSSIQVRAYEEAGKAQAKSATEVAGKAQKRKSTQQAVKDLATQASIQANLAAVQNSTLAELNGNSLRHLGASASALQMQQIQVRKAATLQIMTAMNGSQLANINSGVIRQHNYRVRQDLKIQDRKQRSMQRLIIPRPVSTTASTSPGGTP